MNDALDQLVSVAKQRFGTKQVTLLGTRRAQKRLAQMAEERGLDIAEERQRRRSWWVVSSSRMTDPVDDQATELSRTITPRSSEKASG